MRKGWEIKSLGDVCEFQNGFAFKSNKYKDTGLPVLRITNIQNENLETKKIVFFDPSDYKENFDKYKVEYGDLVVAMSGATTGKIGVNQTDTVFYLNQRVGKFIPRKNILKTYLFYFLSTNVEESLRISAGAAQPNLSTEQIKNFKIPIPPISEQQEIVSILDDAFESIERAKSNAEQNLKNAKELFNVYLHKYFTNKEDGWEEKSLKEVAEYFNGLTYSPKNVSNEGMIVLRSSNIQDGKLDFKDIVRVEIKVKEKIIVRDGDILMCSRNGSQSLVGKTAAINNLSEVMTFGTFMMIIRSEYNPYLAWFFKSTAFKNQISSGENPMINQITRYMLDEISLSFPPVKIQNEIVSQLDSLSDEIKKIESIYQQKLNDLEELKKSILQKAFNGELKISKISA